MQYPAWGICDAGSAIHPWLPVAVSGGINQITLLCGAAGPPSEMGFTALPSLLKKENNIIIY